MTNRERVLAALRFEKKAGVPHHMYFTQQAHDSVVRHTGDPGFERGLNNHIETAYLNRPQQPVRPLHDRDEFGVVWNKSGADRDIGVIENIQIQDLDDLKRYRFPAVDEPFIRGEMEKLMATPPTQFRVAALGFSLFERAWTLMGMEALLCNMLLEQDLVHSLLGEICAWNQKVVAIALEYDVDCIHFGDDWGQQRGLIMGRPHWKEFVEPCLAKMYRQVRDAGKFVSQHSCGDLRDILDDLDRIGLDVYQTFQPEIYGLEYAARLKGRIAVWGGISTQKDLPFRKPGEIGALVEKTVRAFDGTGLILAPTHALPGDVPPENIVALAEAFRRFE